MNMKDALLRVVTAVDEINSLRKAYVMIGLSDNSLFEILCQLIEAVSYMIGESDEVREDSDLTIAFIVLVDDKKSVKERTEELYAEYLKNRTLQAYDENILDHPEQPKPNVMSREEFNEMHRRNGGYRYETPEGDWE